jgi:hypothetical protein
MLALVALVEILRHVMLAAILGLIKRLTLYQHRQQMVVLDTALIAVVLEAVFLEQLVILVGMVFLVAAEVLALADRIVTMREGRVTGEVMRQDATQEKLMTLMTIGSQRAA